MPALQPVFRPVLSEQFPSSEPVPAVPLLMKFMFLSVMLLAVMNSAPLVVQFCTVPPVPSVVLVPVTVNGPAPVLLRLMPFEAPLAEMLLKFNPFAPMVRLRTLSAIPAPEEIVLGEFVPSLVVYSTELLVL